MAKSIKFDYAVIYDGVFYPAGALIPVKEEAPADNKEKAAKKNANKRTGGKAKSKPNK